MYMIDMKNQQENYIIYLKRTQQFSNDIKTSFGADRCNARSSNDKNSYILYFKFWILNYVTESYAIYNFDTITYKYLC